MVIPAMNCFYVPFLLPATHRNVMNDTIRDTHATTYVDYRMSYQDNTTIVTEALLIPSPLYVYIVHVFVAMDHMTTLVVSQQCRLIITYKKGLQ